MFSKAFISPHRTGLLSLGLVLALLFGTVLDSAHQHDGPIGELQCYTCHFSPDLGLAAAIGCAPVADPGAVRVSVAGPAPACSGEPSPYSARGPPLLT